jgi:hypothetical protein
MDGSWRFLTPGARLGHQVRAVLATEDPLARLLVQA